MGDEILKDSAATLQRIEGKIDASSTRFDQHAASDEAAFRELAKRQSGFMGGVLSVAIAIGAGIAYMARRILGH